MAVPVLDNDWSPYYDVLDLFPGTVLIEDPIEPTLVFHVQAESDFYAHAYVGMALDVVGVQHTKVCVALADRLDFEYAEEWYVELT